MRSARVNPQQLHPVRLRPSAVDDPGPDFWSGGQSAIHDWLRFQSTPILGALQCAAVAGRYALPGSPPLGNAGGFPALPSGGERETRRKTGDSGRIAHQMLNMNNQNQNMMAAKSKLFTQICVKHRER